MNNSGEVNGDNKEDNENDSLESVEFSNENYVDHIEYTVDENDRFDNDEYSNLKSQTKLKKQLSKIREDDNENNI